MKNDVLDSINRILAETEGHTPGPWAVGKVRKYGIFAAGQREAVASVRHWPGEKEPMEPNGPEDAALMAAAPDMRALLERIGALLAQLHPLAVTASSSTGTASEVRGARDELVRLCLELGGNS